jgi:hypothetical protein
VIGLTLPVAAVVSLNPTNGLIGNRLNGDSKPIVIPLFKRGRWRNGESNITETLGITSDRFCGNQIEQPESCFDANDGQR